MSPPPPPEAEIESQQPDDDDEEDGTMNWKTIWKAPVKSPSPLAKAYKKEENMRCWNRKLLTSRIYRVFGDDNVCT